MVKYPEKIFCLRLPDEVICGRREIQHNHRGAENYKARNFPEVPAGKSRNQENYETRDAQPCADSMCYAVRDLFPGRLYVTLPCF